MAPAEETESAPYENVKGVAVIPIEGVILREGFLWYCGLKDIEASVEAALNDREVDAILFNIHSPGGQARGVKETADMIYAARRVKPCAAYVDGLCASAAYWLAAATGKIFAGPSSEVGSVGVILRHLDKSGWNKENGLNFTYITAGAYKAVGNPDSALSERDLGVLQGRVNAIYEMFCGDVAQYMNLAVDNRLAWADGRDFLASEALDLGLITAIVTNKTEAINQLLKETGKMDKAELFQKYPELVAEIQSDAVSAIKDEHAVKIEAAKKESLEHALALMETACGKENADKVRALAATGMTPEQLAAAANIFGAKPEAKESSKREEMLRAIKDATPGAIGAGASIDDRSEAEAAILRIGKM